MEGKSSPIIFIKELHCYRPYMKEEGMAGNVELDINDFMDKEFHTFRKTKSFKEAIYYKWNWLNFTNKHYTRATD